jgi:long-chain acyl-CoA synthetase
VPPARATVALVAVLVLRRALASPTITTLSVGAGLPRRASMDRQALHTLRDMSIGFWKIAEEDPGRVAVTAPDGSETSAGELLAHANALVHALRELRLEVGDAVATVLPNCVEVYEVYLACMQSGFYMVPINYHLVADEIAYILRDSGAKALVAHERFAPAVAAAREQAGLDTPHALAIGTIAGFSSYTACRDAAPTSSPPDRTVGEVMNYTSGTTGRPKGVRRPLPGISPEDAGIGLTGILFLFGIQPDGHAVHLVCSPLYHTAPLRFSTAALHLGHHLVLMDGWDSEGMLKLVERHRVTDTHMVPTQFHRLLALPDEVRQRYDHSSLEHVIHAAAPCPVDIKRRMIEWWGPVIYEYYAATEGGGTLVTAEEWLLKPGTVGKPWPISEIVILDDDGNPLGPNEVGTVYMAINGLNFEYYHDPEKTASARRGRFFTVGDMGYLDEDGYLFLCDRKSDMIISGGANIYPAEIEAVLLTHPKVADAAVFGIPNEEWGEEVKAVIEPAPGVAPSSELAEEILEHCRARLAKFKLPRTIDFVDELPRDPNGKLYKRKLRDPYWAGRERAI